MEPDFAFPVLNLISEVVVNAPDIMVITGFALLALLLFCSGLMSASEAAYFSLGSEDIDSFRSSSSGRARYAIKLVEMPERLLSTILACSIIINVTIVLLSAFISAKLFDFSAAPFTGFLLQAVVITFLILLFGEILPKKYASGNKVKIALFISPVLIILEKIFRPLASLLIVSSSYIKRKTAVQRSSITMDDLSDALELASSDDLDEDEKILKGILSFGNLNVSAVMCPRIDVTAIEIGSSFSEAMTVIVDSGFSRIPVYAESFDEVKGVLYAKDLLPIFSNQEGFSWQTLIRPPYFVPETKKINDLLKEFQINKIHMAIVVDEYGGTSGIITLEDILEEIV
ncbi:MAG: CNNM domain-containing protein, partial [Bacteroidales bacterium]|nr:CNNM domain-containing protein [Bacteroidales bacterium]